MAINFTDSPADGATQVISGRTYTYNSAKNKWDTTATEVVGPTAKTYATVNDLPGTALTGDQAFVSGTNRLYIWNGSGWYNIALVNSTPTWTTQPDSSYTLASDGTATTITIVATDPEGLPITYSIASDTSGNIATVAQGTGLQANTWTITPSTSEADAGTFSLTFRASDGVNVASAISSFTLQFRVENSNYTTALITSVGTNNQVNNNFVDSSSANYTLTAAGNPTQSTFSPYRHGGYSYHWDGSGTDYFQILSPTAALDFGTGDFTIEMWIWLNDLSAGIILADLRPSETNGNQYIGAYAIGTDGNLQVATGNVQRIVTTGGPITAGSWHHIALQRNSGTLEAYVDGSRNATASFTQSLDANRWSLFKNSFASGGVADGGGGYIKDYRIVKGTAVYSGATYDVPTESLTAISGTSLLLFSNRPTFTYDAADTESITWTNGESAPFSPYDYETYSADVNGGSMYFDGNGDYLSLTASGDLQALGRSGTECTVEAWVNIRSLSSSGVAIYSHGTAGSISGNNIVSFEIRSNRTLRALINGAYQNETGCPSSTTALSFNTWHHIAYVLYNQVWTIYIDGKADGSTGTGSYTSGTNHSSAFINRVFYDAGRVADSNIADLRIDPTTALYTSDFTPPTAPISASAGTQLFLNASNIGIIDKSQSVQALTLNGNVKSSTAQSKYLTSSMYFDGTGDYIRIPNNDTLVFGTGEFTVEFWMYMTSLTRAVFVDKYDGTAASWQIQYRDYNNDNQIAFSTSVGHYATTPSDEIETNTWYHVATVRDSSNNIKIYINGVEKGSSSSYTQALTSTQDLNIGVQTYNIAAGYMNGYMSDVRITKGLARYTANFTPPTAALQG